MSTEEHVITLSTFDLGKPRHYIRLCLAYSLDESTDNRAFSKISGHFGRLVKGAPWLAGRYVPTNQHGGAEIRFSEFDVKLYHICASWPNTEEVPYTYQELLTQQFPVHALPTSLMLFTPETADGTKSAPIMRVQAIFIEGGVLIYVYLHHSVCDGTGMGLVLEEELQGGLCAAPEVSIEGYAAYAAEQSYTRFELSSYNSGHLNSIHKHSEFKLLAPLSNGLGPALPSSSTGDIRLFQLSTKSLKELKLRLEATLPTGSYVSTRDAMSALWWHTLTRLRHSSRDGVVPSTHSKLSFPVNIRNKMEPPLPSTYLGAGYIDVTISQPIIHLLRTNSASLAHTASLIRAKIASISDSTVREIIALTAANADPRELQAMDIDSSRNNVVIVDWSMMGAYSCDMGLGGLPDAVRRPWATPCPGVVTILPSDPRRAVVEANVQLEKAHMKGLAEDEEFGRFVERII